MNIGGITGIVPAGRAVGRLDLIIQAGVPVLAAGHENTIDLGKNLAGLSGGGNLRHEHGIGAVALKGLSKALIVAANGIPLPGDTHHGTSGNVGNGDLHHVAGSIQAQVGSDSLVQGALAHLNAKLGGGSVGLAHGGLQLRNAFDTVVGGVGDLDGTGNLGLVNNVILQIAFTVHGVEDGVFDLLRSGRFRRVRDRHHQAHQHGENHDQTEHPLQVLSSHSFLTSSVICCEYENASSPSPSVISSLNPRWNFAIVLGLF